MAQVKAILAPPTPSCVPQVPTDYGFDGELSSDVYHSFAEQGYFVVTFDQVKEGVG